MRTKTIAVITKGFIGWNGGIDFIRLMLRGLGTQNGIRVIVVIPEAKQQKHFWQKSLSNIKNSLLDLFNRLFGIKIPCTVVDNNNSIFNDDVQPGWIIVSVPNTPQGIENIIQEFEVDVILPLIDPLGESSSCPWVGYLYDFQHRHLPQYFSESDRKARDRHFAAMLARAPITIVNAKDVKKDADLFGFQGTDRIINLPFTPYINQKIPMENAHLVKRKYGIPDSYFIVCNQFWIHKDHLTAMKAFSTFIQENPDSGIELVCTGKMEDYRCPEHITNINNLVSDLQINNSVHFLGHIPKPDQLALLKGAICVIQPTLFEGGPGGGATYDAVANGVPVLLTDIPVNREADAGDLRFFPPGDAENLARLMKEISKNPPSAPSDSVLICASEERLKRLGEALMDITGRAIDRFRTHP